MTDRRWEDEPSMEGFGILQDIRGAPYDPMLTRGELMLAQNQKMLEALQRAEERSGTVEVLPPESHYGSERPINLTILNEHAGAELDHFRDAQFALAETLADQGMMQERLLGDISATNDVLADLSDQAREAYRQRNEALMQLARVAYALEDAGIDLRGLRDDVRDGLQQVDGTIAAGVERLDGTIARSGERIEGAITEAREAIDRSADRVDGRLRDVHEAVIETNATLDRGFGEVTTGLRSVEGAVLETRDTIERGVTRLDERMEQTNATLDRGFGRVDQRLVDVRDGLQQVDGTIAAGVERLDGTIARSGERIEGAITEAREAIDRSADRVDSRLRDVHGAVMETNATLDRGFGRVGAALDGIGEGIGSIDAHVQETNALLARGVDRLDERLEQTNGTLVRGFEGVGNALDGIGSGVAALDAHLQDVHQGIERTNASIIETQRTITRSVDHLEGTLERGVGQLDGSLRGIRGTLERGFALDASEGAAGRETTALVGRELLKGLGTISTQIRGSSNELVRTRLNLLSKLSGLHDVFAWGAREQLWTLRRLQETAEAELEASTHPIRVRSRELREIGERCRAVGDLAGARSRFEACLADDPTDAEARMALALLDVHEGRKEPAHAGFRRAAEHARMAKNAPLAAYVQMHDAHLLLEEQRVREAIGAFKRALEDDVQNYDCWYGLAQAHALADESEAAWEALQPLLAHAPNYEQHILANPLFSALVDRILARTAPQQTTDAAPAPDVPAAAAGVQAPSGSLHTQLDAAKKSDERAQAKRLVDLQVEQLIVSERRSLIMKFREQYAPFLDPIQCAAIDTRIANLAPEPAEVLEALNDEAQLRVRMFTFASTNDVEGLAAILRVRPGLVNLKDDAGNTPLITAVVHRCQTAISYLLEQGADASVADASGMRASGYALNDNNPDLALTLIRHERDQTPGSLAALAYSVLSATRGAIPSSVYLAHQLVLLGANPSYSCGLSLLAYALRYESEPLVRALLERGSGFGKDDCSLSYPIGKNMRIVELLLATHPDSETLNAWLYSACAHGSTELAHRLIEQGADPCARNRIGHTPLHAAAGAGHIENLRLLLSRNVDVHATDREGNTALHLATKHHRVEIAKILVEAGAIPSASNAEGTTPLHFVLACTSIELAAYLLEKGADPNTRMQDGTPLLCAAINRQNSPLATLLLTHAADPNARTPEDVTPLFLAVGIRDEALIHLLLERGAEVNAQVQRTRPLYGAVPGYDAHTPRHAGRTALHLAVEHNFVQIVSLLLEFGADPTIACARGVRLDQRQRGISSTLRVIHDLLDAAMKRRDPSSS